MVMYQTYFSSAQDDDDDDTRVINDLDGALWVHGKESHMCTHNSSTTYLLSAAVNRPATHIPAARARQTHTVPLTSSSSMGSIVAPTTAFSGTCPLSDDTHCKVLEVTIWLYPDMPDSMPTSSAMAQWPIRATHISSGRNILLLLTPLFFVWLRAVVAVPVLQTRIYYTRPFSYSLLYRESSRSIGRFCCYDDGGWWTTTEGIGSDATRHRGALKVDAATAELGHICAPSHLFALWTRRTRITLISVCIRWPVHVYVCVVATDWPNSHVYTA